MSDDLTPREVIARTLENNFWDDGGVGFPAAADDVVAALTAFGIELIPRADQWGIRCPDGYVIFRDTDKGQQDWSHQAEVRAIAATWNDPGYIVVHRQAAGPWEVVPDVE